MANRIGIIASVAGLTAGVLLPACGGHDTKTAPPPPVVQTQIQAATPGDVLALAKVSSETSDPLTVGADALAASALDDETSDPIPVT